jgi:hypothetical protein
MIDRWGWFDALVLRSTQDDLVAPSAALSDAILWLGLRPTQLRSAIGAALGVPGSRVATPDPRDVARVDGRRLAALAPPLLGHDSPEIRGLAERWLTAPAAAYQIPEPTLEAWLRKPGPCGDLLHARLADEGLALLSPDALGRLAHDSCRGPVRAVARMWIDRLAS